MGILSPWDFEVPLEDPGQDPAPPGEDTTTIPTNLQVPLVSLTAGSVDAPVGVTQPITPTTNIATGAPAPQRGYIPEFDDPDFGRRESNQVRQAGTAFPTVALTSGGFDPLVGASVLQPQQPAGPQLTAGSNSGSVFAPSVVTDPAEQIQSNAIQARQAFAPAPVVADPINQIQQNAIQARAAQGPRFPDPPSQQIQNAFQARQAQQPAPQQPGLGQQILGGVADFFSSPPDFQAAGAQYPIDLDPLRQNPAVDALALRTNRRLEDTPSRIDALAAVQSAYQNPIGQGTAIDPYIPDFVQGAVGAGLTGIGAVDNNLRAAFPDYRDVGNIIGTGIDAVFQFPAELLNTTPVPGTNAQVGQFANATVKGLKDGGSELFRVIANEGGMMNMPRTLSNTLLAAQNGFETHIQAYGSLNEQIKQLPPEVRDEAKLATLTNYSGPEVAQQTLDEIVNKDTKVRQLRELAQEAFDKGDFLQASRYGYEAERLNGMSTLEIVEKNLDPLAELGYSLVLDPTMIWGLAAKGAGLTNRKRFLQGALDARAVTPAEASTAAREAIRRANPQQVTTWDRLNPLAPSVQTQIDQTGNAYWRMFGSMLHDITNGPTAQRLVSAFADDPAEFIRRMADEGQPVLDEGGNVVRSGHASYAVDPVLENIDVIEVAKEKLKNLSSLATDDGTFNRFDVMTEIWNVVTDARREILGVVEDGVPRGVDKFNERVLDNGDVVVDMLDAKGNVVRSSDPMSASGARAFVQEQAEQSSRGPRNPVRGLANVFDSLTTYQKVFVNEVWLSTPKNILQNMTNAFMTAIADDSADKLFKNVKNVDEDILGRFGGIFPDPRLQEAVTGPVGAQQTARRALEEKKLLQRVPVIGNLIEGGLDLAYGNVNFFNRLPVGEQAIAKKIWYSGFDEVLRDGWDTVLRQGLPQLRDIGIDDQTAQRFLDHLREAARRPGARQRDINQAAQDFIDGNTVNFSLRELGIDITDITPDGQQRIYRAFQDGTDPQEIRRELSRIFIQEEQSAASLLAETPLEPGRYAWTNREIAETSAEIVDDMKRAVRNSGRQVNEAVSQQINEVAQAVNVEVGQYRRLIQDMAQSGNAQAVRLASDVWAQAHMLKTEIRKRLQTVAQDAAEIQRQFGTGHQRTNAAWNRYYDEATNAWTGYRDQFQELADTARNNIDGIRRGETPQVQTGPDTWDLVEDYMRFNEEEIRTARNLSPTSPVSDSDTLSRVISANRQYVDSQIARVYGILQNVPARAMQEAFDLVVSSEQQAQRLGAMARAYVNEAKDRLFDQKINLDQFYEIRNRTWHELADAQVVEYNTTQRQIAEVIARDNAYSDLRFNDIFDEEWQVFNRIEREGNILYEARNADGNVARFGEPNNGQISDIPQQVADEWRARTRNLPQEIDEIVEQVNEVFGPQEMPDGFDLELAEFRRNNPYDIHPNWGRDWFAVKGNETPNLYDIQGDLNTSRNSILAQAFHMGDIGDVRIQRLNRARRLINNNIDRLLNAGPNQIAEAQRLRLMDVTQDLTGRWSDVLNAAVDGGVKVMNEAMLDFGNQANIDVWMSKIFGYHYWPTYTRWNWTKRTLTKPQHYSRYYKWKQAVQRENEQSEVPRNVAGTLPLPGTDNLRIGDPVGLFYPFSLYEFNEFANPEEADSNFERAYETSKLYGLNFLPLYDSAVKYAFGRGDEIQIGDFAWPIRGAEYAYRAVTGQNLLPEQGFFSGVDEFEEGRMAREIQNLVASGTIDQETALLAQEQITQGRFDLESIPEFANLTPQQQQAVQNAVNQARQNSASRRLTTVGPSRFLPANLYYTPPIEPEVRAARAEQRQLGFDPVANPAGSQAAVDVFREQPVVDGGGTVGETLGTYYSFLYGDEAPTGYSRPAVRAATNRYWDEVNGILDTMNADTAQFIVDNPGASEEEVRDFKGSYFDDIEAAGARYPSVQRKFGDSDDNVSFTRNQNPLERAQSEINTLLSFEPPGRPVYPGEGASPEQLQQYYNAKRVWEQQRLSYVESTLGQYLAGGPQPFGPDGGPQLSPGQDTFFNQRVNESVGLTVQGKYAADLLRAYRLRYATEIEALWSEQRELEQQFNTQLWEERRGRIENTFGGSGLQLWEQYLDLPKNSPERANFRANNPIIRQINMQAYDPEGYQAALSTFGADIFELAASYPAGKSKEVKDTEARQQFGNDILDLANNSPRGGTSEQWRDYYRSIGDDATNRLRAYFEWNKQQNPERKAWYAEQGQENVDRLFAYFDWSKNRQGGGDPAPPALGTPEAQALLSQSATRAPIGGAGVQPAGPEAFPRLSDFSVDPTFPQVPGVATNPVQGVNVPAAVTPQELIETGALADNGPTLSQLNPNELAAVTAPERDASRAQPASTTGTSAVANATGTNNVSTTNASSGGGGGFGGGGGSRGRGGSSGGFSVNGQSQAEGQQFRIPPWLVPYVLSFQQWQEQNPGGTIEAYQAYVNQISQQLLGSGEISLEGDTVGTQVPDTLPLAGDVIANQVPDVNQEQFTAQQLQNFFGQDPSSLQQFPAGTQPAPRNIQRNVLPFEQWLQQNPGGTPEQYTAYAQSQFFGAQPQQGQPAVIQQPLAGDPVPAVGNQEAFTSQQLGNFFGQNPNSLQQFPQGSQPAPTVNPRSVLSFEQFQQLNPGATPEQYTAYAQQQFFGQQPGQSGQSGQIQGQFSSPGIGVNSQIPPGLQEQQTAQLLGQFYGQNPQSLQQFPAGTQPNPRNIQRNVLDFNQYRQQVNPNATPEEYTAYAQSQFFGQQAAAAQGPPLAPQGQLGPQVGVSPQLAPGLQEQRTAQLLQQFYGQDPRVLQQFPVGSQPDPRIIQRDVLNYDQYRQTVNPNATPEEYTAYAQQQFFGAQPNVLSGSSIPSGANPLVPGSLGTQSAQAPGATTAGTVVAATPAGEQAQADDVPDITAEALVSLAEYNQLQTRQERIAYLQEHPEIAELIATPATRPVVSGGFGGGGFQSSILPSIASFANNVPRVQQRRFNEYLWTMPKSRFSSG